MRSATASFAALGALVVLSCARGEPSRAPLSPAVPRPDGPVRPSSSRAVEGTEETEERNEVEIVLSPSDDDDTANGASKAPPDCARLTPASSCLGASIAQRACEKLGPAVEPRVGAEWLSCMLDPASGSSCDSHRVVECGLRAVGKAGVDGTYHALCGEIASSCADVAEQITAPVCEHLIAAWRPERRSQIIECLRHGCETGGFGICLP